MPDTYRSYVVRVRRRREDQASLRLEIEDLLGGRRATLEGAGALDLSTALESAMADGATSDEPAERALGGEHSAWLSLERTP